MKSLSSLLKEHNFVKGCLVKDFGDVCAKDLTRRGYIYNEVIGFEKSEIIERFNLNPNMRGIPCTLQPKWIEVKDGYEKDNYGNKIKKEIKTKWAQSLTEKKWYPSKDWFAYMEFKKNRGRKFDAIKINTPPIEYYENS